MKRSSLIAVLCFLGFAGFGSVEKAVGVDKQSGLAKEARGADHASSESAPPSEKTRQAVKLTGGSSKNLILAPPCSVIDVNGRNVSLRDFYGKQNIVQVENAADIKVGDKVVVKKGWLIVGISRK